MMAQQLKAEHGKGRRKVSVLDLRVAVFKLASSFSYIGFRVEKLNTNPIMLVLIGDWEIPIWISLPRSSGCTKCAEYADCLQQQSELESKFLAVESA